jgi:choline dehydrogenase-like flavoprotein
VVIEKGPWFKESDFFKDEIDECNRHKFTPRPQDEPQVVETLSGDDWVAEDAAGAGWEFWNGSMVGGATNIMSGFFLRMKPQDFRLRSEFGPIEGADVRDWPISYEDLEPYYAMVEREVGVSGRVRPHPFAEPRSTVDFPFPPTSEHPLAGWIDRAAEKIGAHAFPMPRAILPYPHNGRNSCSYTGFCGNYGCATGAKGSARAALIDRAVKTGRCEIRPNCMAAGIVSDQKGLARELRYFDSNGEEKRLSATIFVVACQPIETTRLLLMSIGPRHPDGLGNAKGILGSNLLFSSGASAEGAFPYERFDGAALAELKLPLPFINRTVQDWYVIDDRRFGPRAKGGSLDFMFVHPNPIALARWFAFSSGDRMTWGTQFKNDLRSYIKEARHVMVEVFADWLPLPNCRVSLDSSVKDKWGLPVARIRMDSHPHHRKVAEYLSDRAAEVLEAAGALEIETSASGGPSTNLPAGTCRFGHDAESSFLDPECRAHHAENLFVSDGSFMPTGGSVPYTWTIYANSFRVADAIIRQLGKGSDNLNT